MTSLAAQYAGQFVDVGTRAAGGPVQAGQPYIVGEVGPELFVPSQSGAIVPNHSMGGSTTVYINYTPTFSTASLQEIEAFVPVVERSMRQIQGFS